MSLSNQQVAKIYDSMLIGDKNALFKLQNIRVKNHAPRFIQSYYKKKVKDYDQYQDKIIENTMIDKEQQNIQIESNRLSEYPREDNMQPPPQVEQKDNSYLIAIKKQIRIPLRQDVQKVKPNKNRRIMQSMSGYYKKQKPNIDKMDIKLQQKINNKPKSIDIVQPHKIQKSTTKYLLPKVNKHKEEPQILKNNLNKQKEKVQMIKAQSAHMQPIKKIINLQASAINSPKKHKEKVDFKEIINKNKIQKQLYTKINQQQRQIQQQLIKIHINNKQYLNKIYQKYNLNDNDMTKIITNHNNKKKKKTIAQIPTNVDEGTTTTKISPFIRNMNNQKTKCMQLYDQINCLSSTFNRNYMNLKKIEKARSQLLFQRYLQIYGLQIQEQMQEEVDIVEPLIDGEEKYIQIMALTRQKKWGLHQRHQYESQRTQSLSQSRQTNKSRFTQLQTQTNETSLSQNKITFNQNLKKLLFS